MLNNETIASRQCLLSMFLALYYVPGFKHRNSFNPHIKPLNYVSLTNEKQNKTSKQINYDTEEPSNLLRFTQPMSSGMAQDCHSTSLLHGHPLSSLCPAE